MRRTALILLVLAVPLGAGASAAHTAPPGLPPPVFTTTGGIAIVAASGPTAALATVGSGACPIRLFRLGRTAVPTQVKAPNPCDPETEGFVDYLWLGRTSIGALVYDSPSPHGEDFTYFAGPRPAGALRAHGDSWGWQDSEEPYGYGCEWAVVAGGGVIAAATIPHRLGYDHGLDQPKPAYPASETTTVELSGAATPRVVVTGSWEPLARDGTRLLLGALDENGERTGELALVDAHGTQLTPPAVDAAVVKRVRSGWLTTQGLVLETPSGITAPRWSVKENGLVTVGEGRVLYVNRRVLHVRRIRDGADRTLLTLPRTGDYDLAAGSFGVAIATASDSQVVKLYRVPWRTIDRVLPA